MAWHSGWARAFLKGKNEKHFMAMVLFLQLLHNTEFFFSLEASYDQEIK